MSTNALCVSHVAAAAEAVPLSYDIPFDEVLSGGDEEKALAEVVAFFSEEGSVNDLRTPTPGHRATGA